MNIIKPSKNEKDRAITEILQTGLIRPKSLVAHLKELYTALGINYIFWDMTQAIIISAIVLVGILGMYFQISAPMVYATSFIFAPFLFILIVFFADIIERLSGLYELKMTFKYTMQQITAFRILCFSLLGVLFCVMSSVVIEGEFLRVFAVSICALFLCALFTAFVTHHFSPKWQYASLTAWVVISILITRFGDERWNSFLANTPITVTLFVACAVFALFLFEIRKMIITRKEVVSYVGS